MSRLTKAEEERLAKILASGAPPRKPKPKKVKRKVVKVKRNYTARQSVQKKIAEGDGQGNINSNRVIVLNMGLGRDSMTMLALLKQGKLVAEGHIVRPQDVDAVVFSDPGAEWDHTYLITRVVEKTAKQLGIPFYWLKKPMECDWEEYLHDLRSLRRAKGSLLEGLNDKEKASVRRWRTGQESLSVPVKAKTGYYHLNPPIIEHYELDRPSGPMLVGFGDKACTVNHKIAPIRSLMNDLSIEKFELGNRAWGNRVKAGRAVPHLNLVGLAADEESRASKRHAYNPARWQGKAGPYFVDEAYPLMEMGITKAGEQPVLESEGWGYVRKSGCFMCPYQPLEWYWLLDHKARQGNQWAQTAMTRLTRAQRRVVEHGKAKRAAGELTPAGELYPIYVRIMDRRIQGDRTIPMQDRDGKRKRPRRSKGGEDMLLIPQAVPVIAQKLVEPRIGRYVSQGMSRKRATEKVAEEILKKDYAQGCKDGSVNRHSHQQLGTPRSLKSWGSRCPGCGG